MTFFYSTATRDEMRRQYRTKFFEWTVEIHDMTRDEYVLKLYDSNRDRTHSVGFYGIQLDQWGVKFLSYLVENLTNNALVFR